MSVRQRTWGMFSFNWENRLIVCYGLYGQCNSLQLYISHSFICNTRLIKRLRAPPPWLSKRIARFLQSETLKWESDHWMWVILGHKPLQMVTDLNCPWLQLDNIQNQSFHNPVLFLATSSLHFTLLKLTWSVSEDCFHVKTAIFMVGNTVAYSCWSRSTSWWSSQVDLFFAWQKPLGSVTCSFSDHKNKVSAGFPVVSSGFAVMKCRPSTWYRSSSKPLKSKKKSFCRSFEFERLFSNCCHSLSLILTITSIEEREDRVWGLYVHFFILSTDTGPRPHQWPARCGHI